MKTEKNAGNPIRTVCRSCGHSKSDYNRMTKQCEAFIYDIQCPCREWSPTIKQFRADGTKGTEIHIVDKWEALVI